MAKTLDDLAAKVVNTAASKAAMNNLGICGAHRTGKTTLAIALSEKLNIPFIRIDTSEIFARYNLDPTQPMDFRSRLPIQFEILDHATEIWFRADQPFICDRTPLDMAAYLLSAIGNNNHDAWCEKKTTKYLEACNRATEEYFQSIVLVPPAIPIVHEQGKASPSRGYIEHIHLLCLGLLQESAVDAFVIDKNVHFDAAVSAVKRFMGVYN